MEFTYDAYQGLLTLLKQNQYRFCNYHNCDAQEKCVIMRHDIDYSMEHAVRLAELEHEVGVQSTYFVLLRTDFYNPASKHVNDMLRRIHSMGHEIGLHFDEVAYLDKTTDRLPEYILHEAKLLSDMSDCPIRSFSMHRPNKLTIEQQFQVPGLVNAYGQEFFHEYKYLSDSRRNWREPVETIIQSGEYEKLHILTHAFWYNEKDVSISDAVKNHIYAAKVERYWHFSENIRDLDSLVSFAEVESSV